MSILAFELLDVLSGSFQSSSWFRIRISRNPTRIVPGDPGCKNAKIQKNKVTLRFQRHTSVAIATYSTTRSFTLWEKKIPIWLISNMVVAIATTTLKINHIGIFLLRQGLWHVFRCDVGSNQFFDLQSVRWRSCFVEGTFNGLISGRSLPVFLSSFQYEFVGLSFSWLGKAYSWSSLSQGNR